MKRMCPIGLLLVAACAGRAAPPEAEPLMEWTETTWSESPSMSETLLTMSVRLRLADEALERGEFESARENARRVLALDPDNRMAWEKIRTANALQREAFDQEWRRVMERLECGCDLCPDDLEYPAEWDEIAEK